MEKVTGNHWVKGLCIIIKLNSKNVKAPSLRSEINILNINILVQEWQILDHQWDIWSLSFKSREQFKKEVRDVITHMSCRKEQGRVLNVYLSLIMIVRLSSGYQISWKSIQTLTAWKYSNVLVAFQLHVFPILSFSLRLSR